MTICTWDGLVQATKRVQTVTTRSSALACDHPTAKTRFGIGSKTLTFRHNCRQPTTSVISTLAASNGKRNASVSGPSVRLSVPFSPTLMIRAAYIHRDSPGGSTRHGQRTFPFEYYEDGIFVNLGLLCNG